MKYSLTLILFLIISTFECNAQDGWYPQESNTDLFLRRVFFIDESNGIVVGNNK